MKGRQDIQKRRVWETRLERYRVSGLTVARFCSQEGVSANRFYYWARRVAGTAVSAGHSTAQDGGTSGRSRRSEESLATTTANAPARVVRFHWSAGVEVAVPADCLDAIRCLAQCLPQSPLERLDGFQELVVHS